jgi:hypothetical protein
MTSPFADTSKIDLKVLLDSVYKAEELIRKFVRKHLEKPKVIPNKSKLRMNNPNIRTQYFGLMMFYQQILIPYFDKKVARGAEEKIARKWRAAGQEPYYKRVKDGVIDTVAGFQGEVNELIAKLKKTNKEYWRVRAEETRLGSADNIVKGGSPESELPSGLDLDEDGESEHEHEVPGDNTKVPCPGGGNCSGEFCGGVDKATGWRKGGSKNKWYCGFCWGAIFGDMEEDFIKRIKDLDKLSEDEKQNFIKQVRSSPSKQIIDIWEQAEEKNKSRGGDERDKDEDDEEVLQSEIEKVIQDIEEELNREPRIIGRDQKWRVYIWASPSLKELKSRKNEVLNDIQDARLRKSQLDQLIKESIQKIKEELAEDPPIGSEELDNPNW